MRLGIATAELLCKAW